MVSISFMGIQSGNWYIDNKIVEIDKEIKKLESQRRYLVENRF